MNTPIQPKKFTTIQLFNIVDGRLSTSMGDVHDMLGHICQMKGIMTHHLPIAMRYVEHCNPDWRQKVQAEINIAKNKVGNDFTPLAVYLTKNGSEYEIPALPAELLTDETFGKFMVDNSLLLE